MSHVLTALTDMQAGHRSAVFCANHSTGLYQTVAFVDDVFLCETQTQRFFLFDSSPGGG
jgi:hypothetical protein